MDVEDYLLADHEVVFNFEDQCDELEELAKKLEETSMDDWCRSLRRQKDLFILFGEICLHEPILQFSYKDGFIKSFYNRIYFVSYHQISLVTPV